ncbi:MAG: hypothetical protein QOG53_283 [Frankiales bacterium]|nr:hypothetical protein [Frankiales bacterium]
MQTFLPYPDFAMTAVVLDERRLGRQRVEALQVLRALTRDTYGWKNHPAVLMWWGYAEAVASYGIVMCAEWSRRGHPDTCAASISMDLGEVPRTQEELDAAEALPPWLGDEAFHRSHQAALVRKDPEHYRPLFPDVDPKEPYYWPVPRRTKHYL